MGAGGGGSVTGGGVYAGAATGRSGRLPQRGHGAAGSTSRGRGVDAVNRGQGRSESVTRASYRETFTRHAVARSADAS
jgi:hypothetical protein